MSNETHPSRLTVSENGAGRYQQTVRSGRHELIADEPVARVAKTPASPRTTSC
jgi:hypothetical protein